MKLHALVLGLVAFLLGFSALADVSPIQSGTKEDDVSITAMNINSVYNFMAKEIAYKVVSLESELNSDTNGTTIVLAGVGGVGGEVGADASFLVGPTPKNFYLVSARIVQNEIELTFGDLDLKRSKTLYHYDAKTKTLVESAGLFAPKKIVHANGKSFTECTDAHEQLQKFKSGRFACVNKAGEFYFLAN
jgi:hypothetical protein